MRKTYLSVLDKRIAEDDYLKSDKVRDAKRVLNVFGPRFDFEHPLLLSKGFRQALQKKAKTLALPFSNRLLKQAVDVYVHSPRYAKKYLVGATRFDLEGNPAGQVTQKEVDTANNYVKTVRHTLIKRSREKGHAND